MQLLTSLCLTYRQNGGMPPPTYNLRCVPHHLLAQHLPSSSSPFKTGTLFFCATDCACITETPNFAWKGGTRGRLTMLLVKTQ